MNNQAHYDAVVVGAGIGGLYAIHRLRQLACPCQAWRWPAMWVYRRGTNRAVNDVVAEFVRQKIRQIVKDPEVAERPRTMLGLMTHGFPNLFFLTGPGSPSVLSNLILMNEEHVNWVADLIAHMDGNGLKAVEPELEAEENWGEQVADVAKNLLRLNAKNYMVHVNQDDRSRVFIPYTGGFDHYIAICRDIAEQDYPGFAFSRAEQGTNRSAMPHSRHPAQA